MVTVRRSAVSERVRLACFDAVNRAFMRSTLIGIPASIVLAMILGSAVPFANRVAFVLAVSVADVFAFIASVKYLHRRKFAKTVRHWPGLISATLVGFAWALPAIIALPSERHVELRAVYLLFVCGVSATSVVGSAARRSYFYATQIAMMAPVAVVLLLSGERVTHLLGFAVPIYFVTMSSLHHDAHRVVISELTLRESNDIANAALRDANVTLTELALRDDLTGYANRTAFVDHLDRAVAAARRDGSTIGLLYFDIDRFKIVNDSLGHGAGDQLLIQVAHRVQTVLRKNDVLARLGGDEFTVFLDRLGDGYEALLIGRRVADTFAEPFNVQGRRLNVTASLGVATNLHVNDDGETLLAHADAAQYRAKESGRNRVEVFDIALREAIERRLDDEQALRDALDANQIVAYYQPQIDVATGRIVGAEALARWIHPERGVLGAPCFVPLAEESGLVFALDGAIVQQSISARVALTRLGIPQSFRIWCNVSARQLTRGEPADQLAALLRRTGCDARGIGIEITETAVLPDIEAAERQITMARQLGIECALDDFGTGHSSLTLLRSLSIDKVKIDRSFVADLGIDPADTAIVRGVIGLAEELGLDVIAEGVETPEQAAMLVSMGCKTAQGFLWSQAVTYEELVERLRHQGLVAASPNSALTVRSSQAA